MFILTALSPTSNYYNSKINISDRIECSEGFFGAVCEHHCSANCKTSSCDINDGSCECKVGYAGNPCTKCPSNCNPSGCNDNFHCHTCIPGFYIDFCYKTCSEHCKNNWCDRSGRCPCKVGFGGHPCEACPANCDNTGCDEQLKCHECDPDFDGDYCNLTCSTNCINGTCNRDGSCTCKEGFDGFGCCPENCEGGCNDKTFICSSCKEGYHGDFCNDRCPDNCKNGCTHNKGKCNKCIKGYWGDVCDKGKEYFFIHFRLFHPDNEPNIKSK